MYLVAKINLLIGYDMKSLTLDYIKIGFIEQSIVSDSDNADSFSVYLSFRKWGESPEYKVEMCDVEHRNGRKYSCVEDHEYRWESKANECQAQADALNRFILLLSEYFHENANTDGERILEPTEQSIKQLINLVTTK